MTPAVYDASRQWVHYLTRPFNLFGASLWQRWYATPSAAEIFGAAMSDVLFLEEHSGVVRHYRTKGQLELFEKTLKQKFIGQADEMRRFLEEGMRLNEQATSAIQGTSVPASLEEALDFLMRLARQATVLPFWAGTCSQDPRTLALTERMRSISWYPEYVEKIIFPLAQERARGLSDLPSEMILDFVTMDELLAGKSVSVRERYEAQQRGERFVYQNLDGQESVHWVPMIEKLIAEIEQREESQMSSSLTGRTAYPGTVRGRARIRFSMAESALAFDEGDILVTINSNPSLMPLIKKCGAIVTDEGGVTCHAAIISRELHKPCIIGTKYATSFFKEGEEIVVDAARGIVARTV